MEYVVYMITNLSNGKVYIGSSNNFKRRKVEHLRLAFGKLREEDFDSINPVTGRKKVGNIRVHDGMYLDFRELGESSFDIKLIEICESKEEMLKKENYWIVHYYENSYNTIWMDEKGKNHSRTTKLTGKQWGIYKKIEKAFSNENCHNS